MYHLLVYLKITESINHNYNQNNNEFYFSLFIIVIINQRKNFKLIYKTKKKIYI